MTLAQAKREFRKAHPNLRVNGLDGRDSDLWSQLRQLPSYGLLAGDQDNPMISRKEVIRLIELAAEARFKADWEKRFGQPPRCIPGGAA